MEVQTRTKNVNVTPRLQDYIDKKVSKLDRYLPGIMDVKLDLATEHRKQGGDRAVAQLTVRNRRGIILRAEDKSQDDVFAAIDLVLDKMYRQIRSYKGKRRRRGGEKFAELEPELAAAEPVPGEEAADQLEPKMEIVRRKSIQLLPMSEEEAIEQMELLGHDFFVFFDAETSLVSVLYRREDGNYGILEPEVVAVPR